MAYRAEEDLVTLDEILREGQRLREFRPFDTRAMALFVLSLRNGVIQRYHVMPDLDLDVVGRELLEMVDRATRADPPPALEKRLKGPGLPGRRDPGR